MKTNAKISCSNIDQNFAVGYSNVAIEQVVDVTKSAVNNQDVVPKPFCLKELKVR